MKTVKITTDDDRSAELALVLGEKTREFFGGHETPSPQESADTLQAVAMLSASLLTLYPMALNEFLDEVRRMATKN